ILLFDPLVNRVDVGLRLFEFHARFESADQSEKVSATHRSEITLKVRHQVGYDLMRVHPDLRSELSGQRKVVVETLRHYSYYSHVLPVQGHRPADDIGAAAEPAAPQTVADKGNPRCSRTPILRLENTAQEWSRSKH